MPAGTVLCIDDDPVILRLVTEALKRIDARVVPLQNPAEAAATVAAERIDLILCDVNLPDIDGYALVAEIQRSVPEPVPVIFMSATPGEAWDDRASGVGAVDFIRKPIPLAELRARVQARLASRGAAGSPDSRGPRPAEGPAPGQAEPATAPAGAVPAGGEASGASGWPAAMERVIAHALRAAPEVIVRDALEQSRRALPGPWRGLCVVGTRPGSEAEEPTAAVRPEADSPDGVIRRWMAEFLRRRSLAEPRAHSRAALIESGALTPEELDQLDAGR